MDLCARRLPASYGYSPYTDIQVLAPGRKGEVGTNELNKKLQAVINPPEKGKKEIRVAFEWDNLGIWHWPHAEVNYVCIEPWSSLPSRKNIVEDLETQPGLLSLDAGKVYETVWSVSVGEKQ